jgi:hypothetical protein
MDKFQQSFLRAILHDETSAELSDQIRPVGSLTPEGVMDVYRGDYAARMMEALGKSFETTWLLMGDEDFFKAGKAYIKNNPSHVKNLSAYGNSFPEFLSTLELDEDIVRMAQYERAFWRLFHTPPKNAGVISPENLENLEFHLGDTLYLSHSNLKLNHLWAVRENPPADMSLDDYMEEEYLALYRTNEKVQVKKLSAIQFEVFTLLTIHKKIPAVFEALEHHESPPSAEEWAAIFDILKFLI